MVSSQARLRIRTRGPGGLGRPAIVWSARWVAVAAALALSACRPSGGVGGSSPISFEPSNERAELCSGANIVGVGLRAEYFEKAGWRGEPMLVRTDGSVDFVGAADLPEELRATPPKSIRWTGWIKAPTHGAYRFHVMPADARVSVSRQDLDAGHAAAGAPVDMMAGRFYSIVVEVDGLTAASLPVRLEWTAPHGARYVIPRALLNLPTETVAPAQAKR